MKNLKIIYLLIILSFIFYGLGCEKKKEEIEKVRTIADKPLPADAFKADISIKNPPNAVKANSVSSITVEVKNISSILWPAKGQPDGKYRIGLAYHWLDKDGKVVIWDGIRTPLPHDLKPGEEVTLNALIRSPDKPGDFILEFDMVQERVAWFKDRGSKNDQVQYRC